MITAENRSLKASEYTIALARVKNFYSGSRLGSFCAQSPLNQQFPQWRLQTPKKFITL